MSKRSTSAAIAADISWSKTTDRSARTAPARSALQRKFEAEVDPEGIMSPGDRAKAVENYRRAYYRRLALKSAQSRRAKAKTSTTTDDLSEAS